VHRRRYLIASLVLVTSTVACQREAMEISQADKAAVQATTEAAAVAWAKTRPKIVSLSPTVDEITGVVTLHLRAAHTLSSAHCPTASQRGSTERFSRSTGASSTEDGRMRI
jgi:hypothetical protein